MTFCCSYLYSIDPKWSLITEVTLLFTLSVKCLLAGVWAASTSFSKISLIRIGSELVKASGKLKWKVKVTYISKPKWFNLLKHLELCVVIFSKGYYTCVEVIFTLRRQVGFYMMGVYAPTLLIVVLSWLSFWINPDASAARVPLGNICFWYCQHYLMSHIHLQLPQ